MDGQRMRKITAAVAAVEARRAVEKARRAAAVVSGEKSGCCGAPLPVNNEVLLESSYLNAQRIVCPVYLRTPVQPESVRINALMQSTMNAYGSATDPAQRFVEYQGVVIPPACPPVDPNIFNASQGFRQIICPRPRNYYSGL